MTNSNDTPSEDKKPPLMLITAAIVALVVAGIIWSSMKDTDDESETTGASSVAGQLVDADRMMTSADKDEAARRSREMSELNARLEAEVNAREEAEIAARALKDRSAALQASLKDAEARRKRLAA